MAMKQTFLGIVLGGTQLTIGEIDEYGKLLKMKDYQTVFFNQESAQDMIISSLHDYETHVGWIGKRPLAMGVGVIGRVDSEKGIWQQIDPARTHPINLARTLQETFSMPCFVDNDVKASTRAVMRWGAGHESNNFIYLYIGTGIAASIVIDGKQIRGAHFNAGEVGHLKVGTRVGMRCACGRTDCVETIASSVGIDRCARMLRNDYPDTNLSIPSNERVKVEDVFRLAKAGDSLCVKLTENATDALADLIMNLVRVTDPDTIILGGEMLEISDYMAHVKAKLQPVTMRFVTRGVVPTRLDAKNIGLIGAGAVAMDGLENQK
ncbi:ROK family protein [Prevotella sp. kh1p2]|uniref:ROK family protein n=1 Tax=Prevotella sp. kh1p2 TaxID=1761883 RepID=UPI0008B2ABDA|nr:ROK family protein [Prevotella sp. kh1p2]SES63176.1 Sugar kinase of the NBD/HSP70 family, may contain an N-terminal HTH domain [Prevotella sp. kh1p2]SNU10157.1 Sugar kinase of the NBD/HSP70 family, may contain an N-terminal HTH domain [Prevotellaceae bacterium KH2P17]